MLIVSTHYSEIFIGNPEMYQPIIQRF